MFKSGLQRVTSGLAQMRLAPARQLTSCTGARAAGAGRTARVSIKVAYVPSAPQRLSVPEVQYVRQSDLLREIGRLHEPVSEGAAAPDGMLLDSVLRKRRKKMKKHKLRKRRRKERAEKRKLSQGR